MPSYHDLSSLIFNEVQYLFMFCSPFIFSLLSNVFHIFCLSAGWFCQIHSQALLWILLDLPSSSIGFVNRRANNILDFITVVVGNLLGIVICLALSLASTHQMPVVPSSCDNNKNLPIHTQKYLVRYHPGGQNYTWQTTH